MSLFTRLVSREFRLTEIDSSQVSAGYHTPRPRRFGEAVSSTRGRAHPLRTVLPKGV